MLEKDSYVIYGGNGVCRVTDIRRETMYRNTRTYYILTSVEDPNAVIYVPTDNEALLARMREIPGREEILRMLKGLTEEEVAWEKDNRLRGEQFGEILNRCDQRELLVLIRTIWKKRDALAQQGKKLGTSDENVLKRAEKIINGQFGFSLSILPEDVPAFIAEKLAGNESDANRIQK